MEPAGAVQLTVTAPGPAVAAVTPVGAAGDPDAAVVEKTGSTK